MVVLCHVEQQVLELEMTSGRLFVDVQIMKVGL